MNTTTTMRAFNSAAVSYYVKVALCITVLASLPMVVLLLETPQRQVAPNIGDMITMPRKAPAP